MLPSSTGEEQQAARIFRFGEFELREESGELFRGSARLRLPEQSIQVLLALLESPGSLVSREQLRKRLWPDGTYVDFEHSLNAAVKRLRAALEDDAESPRYVETLPRRGYRLIAQVTAADDNAGAETAEASRQAGDAPALPAPPTPARPGRPRISWRAVSGVLLLVVIVAAGIATRAVRHQFQRTSAGSVGASPTGNVLRTPGGEAYELYLRSLAYKLEPPANGQAIKLLEHSTGLEPGFVRSWYELARRYHFEYTMAGGGQGYLQQAFVANRRALELDPEYSPASVQQITLDTEAGQLGTAYRSALAMTRAHPRDGNAHFALSYVLRYGGMYEEAGKECDAALKLDPSNPLYRSCALVFILLNGPERAAVYMDLDPLSTYARFRRLDVAMAANDRTAALEIARSIRLEPNDLAEARMVEAVLTARPRSTVLEWSRASEAIYDRINLSEGYYASARYQAWAGQTEPALRLLRRAIANNHCSYPAMDTDPLLANVRRLPQYAELRQAGMACRDRFRAEMQQAK